MSILNAHVYRAMLIFTLTHWLCLHSCDSTEFSLYFFFTDIRNVSRTRGTASSQQKREWVSMFKCSFHFKLKRWWAIFIANAIWTHIVTHRHLTMHITDLTVWSLKMRASAIMCAHTHHDLFRTHAETLLSHLLSIYL